jgi:membrane-associated phospholipid phosphatase
LTAIFPLLDAGLIGLGAGLYLAAPEVEAQATRSADTHARWSPAAATASDWLSPGGILEGVGAPVTLGALAIPAWVTARSGSGWAGGAVVALESFALTLGITEQWKTRAVVPRPYTSEAFEAAHPDVHAELIGEGDHGSAGDPWKSMPSGHTSMAAWAWSVPGWVWLHEARSAEESTRAPWIAIGGGLAVAAGVGQLRVASGKHHGRDVWTGWALGTAVTAGVATLHAGPADGMALSLHPDGLSLQGRF